MSLSIIIVCSMFVWAGPVQAETTTLLLLLIYSNILNFDLPPASHVHFECTRIS